MRELTFAVYLIKRKIRHAAIVVEAPAKYDMTDYFLHYP
jgi:hypothetical protein